MRHGEVLRVRAPVLLGWVNTRVGLQPGDWAGSSKTGVSLLAVRETPGTWGSAFVVAPMNLCCTSSSCVRVPEMLSRDSAEEPHFHRRRVRRGGL